jgi:GTPase SAR1 family protein
VSAFFERPAPRPIALWIVGEPAAGKTTLARHILQARPENNRHLNGPDTGGIWQKWHVAPGREWFAPGHYTGGTFDGADTVGMSHASKYLDFYLSPFGVDGRPHRGILLDGARFATRPSFDRLSETHATAVCFVESPDCAARRAARGWNPSQTWLAGAITRAQRFRDYARERGAVITFPGAAPWLTVGAET